MQRLKVSDNKRFLVYADGTPFFYLGDTAWELFHRLDRDEIEYYLQDRAAKSFTVVQAVVLAEHEYDRPGPSGHLPLEDSDPARPVEGYFAHVDWVVRRANELGLTVGMLPTWGDKWNKAWGAGPEIFTPENARAYGEFLGRRYADADLIWILGGDRPVETETHRAIIEAMAQGLAEGDGGVHLRTFHPTGQQTSSRYFHADDWLDFNMYQTGHTRDQANWRQIGEDYALVPPQPCLDAEPGYEDHPSGFDAKNGYLDDYNVRKAAYWAVFAGACGHTYGCHDIWQFLDPARFAPITTPRTPWREALKLPGAGQMQHLRALVESRPFLKLVPDQGLIAGDPGDGPAHVQAARAEDGSYAYVYVPNGQSVTVRMGVLAGTQHDAHWYDPRTGAWHEIGRAPSTETRSFSPPTPGVWTDWVLVLDRDPV